MARIFLVLALFSVGLFVANIVTGFTVGDLNGITKRYLKQQQRVQEIERGSSARTEWQEEQGALSEISRQLQQVRGKQNVHFLLGILAVLVGILVNSISVTYFIGTGRWCQEVIDTYSLDEELSARGRRLKLKTFPWSLLSIVLILTVATLGAASDPGANQVSSQTFVQWHWIIAIFTTGLVGWSFLVQVGSVGANFEIIQEILARVEQIRSERGMK